MREITPTRKNYGEFTMSEHYFENNGSKNITQIPVSRLKTLLYLLCSLGAIACSVWMFFAEPTRRYSEWALKLCGTIGVLFFGLCVVVFVIQFFRKGLIISEKGIEDDASFVSLGLIKWEDIEEIQLGEMGKGKQFIIISIHPETARFYIRKIKNPLKKWLIKENYKGYRGHTIPINTLKIKLEELGMILREKHPFYKKR